MPYPFDRIDRPTTATVLPAAPRPSSASPWPATCAPGQAGAPPATLIERAR